MLQFALFALLLPPWLQAAEFSLNPSPNSEYEIASDLESLTKSIILTEEPQSQLIASELLRPICVPGDNRACWAFSMNLMSPHAANLHASMIASMSSTQMLRTFELVELDDERESEGDECRIGEAVGLKRAEEVQIVKFGEISQLSTSHSVASKLSLQTLLAFDLPLLRVQLTDSSIAAKLASQYVPRLPQWQVRVVADQSFTGLHREIVKLMEAEPKLFELDLCHSRTLQVLKAAQVSLFPSSNL